MFDEREEEETGGGTELGRETARKLGKLSGKLACAELRRHHAREEQRDVQHLERQGLNSDREPEYSTNLFSQELNLSYQDLGDPYQQENFLRILRRLIRVEKLQLVDNSLTNLSSVRLPRYEPQAQAAKTSLPVCMCPSPFIK